MKTLKPHSSDWPAAPSPELQIMEEERGGSAPDSTSSRRADPGSEVAPTAAQPLSDRVQSLRLPQHDDTTSAGFGWLPWVLCLALAGTTGAFGYLAFARPGGVDPSGAHTADGSQPPLPAAAGPSAPGSGEVVLESKGYIVPKRQILVSPKVNGRIVELHFQEGDRVKEGQLLVRLEDTEYKADYARAAASLEAAKHRRDEIQRARPEDIRQAEAELGEAEAQFRRAEDQLTRIQELAEKVVSTAQELENAKNELEAVRQRRDRLRSKLVLEKGPREQRVLAAEAEVRQAEADVARAKWRWDSCEITAPITGTILKKNAEQWNIVNPIAMNGSFSLCDMADLADLEVELMIQERDVSRVFAGQKCKVRAEAYPTEQFPDRVYEGRVSRLMPIADRAKGAIPVRVEFRVPRDEEGKYLKPEMGALVTFYNATAPRDLPEPAKKPAAGGAVQK